MDWCGKIFVLFQSNSLPIHRYPEEDLRWPSDGKLRNSHRSKKITLTHLLLISLSHPCGSKHTLHTHNTPESIQKTHIHIPPTYAISAGSRLWGRLVDKVPRWVHLSYIWLDVEASKGSAEIWSVFEHKPGWMLNTLHQDISNNKVQVYCCFILSYMLPSILNLKPARRLAVCAGRPIMIMREKQWT